MRLHKWVLSKKVSCFRMVLMAACTIFSVGVRAGDWSGHLNHLRSSESRIHALEADINHLIESKHHTKGAELNGILAEIASKYRDLKAAVKEREQEITHVRYQHPEKGDNEKRKYTRYQMKTLEQFEEDLSLEGKLDRLKYKVRSQFQVPVAEKKSEVEDGHDRSPTSVPPEDEQIVLRK